MNHPESFILELRDSGDPLKADRSAVIRLRWALKSLLRQQGLRCVRLCDGKCVERKKSMRNKYNKDVISILNMQTLIV